MLVYPKRKPCDVIRLCVVLSSRCISNIKILKTTNLRRKENQCRELNSQWSLHLFFYRYLLCNTHKRRFLPFQTNDEMRYLTGDKFLLP